MYRYRESRVQVSSIIMRRGISSCSRLRHSSPFFHSTTQMHCTTNYNLICFKAYIIICLDNFRSLRQISRTLGIWVSRAIIFDAPQSLVVERSLQYLPHLHIHELHLGQCQVGLQFHSQPKFHGASAKSRLFSFVSNQKLLSALCSYLSSRLPARLFTVLLFIIPRFLFRPFCPWKSFGQRATRPSAPTLAACRRS